MKKVLMLTVLTIVSQSLSAAVINIYNATNSPLEVTARYGSSSTAKTITINRGDKSSINSGIHGFQSIAWRNTNSGVYSALPIPSTRTMLDGIITIGNGGAYKINFNAQGTYKHPQAEHGLSSNTRAMKPNAIGVYPNASA